MALPAQFDGVSVVTKANVYFDGKVTSHTVVFPDGSKKTIGLIYPGTYRFNTGAPERMEISAGKCFVKLEGENDFACCAAGAYFLVPGDSSFEVSVEQGIAEYICSFG